MACVLGDTPEIEIAKMERKGKEDTNAMKEDG
jgi:hypothetical protein